MEGAAQERTEPVKPHARTARRRAAAVALVALSLLTAARLAPAAAAEAAPTAVVESLHAALLDAMQRADALGFEGRYELLRPVLADSFDFHTIARIVTGRYWGDTDETQREAFRAAFEALSAATYATNFSGYAGEQFETRGTEDSRGAKIVRTVLVKPDGEEIPLNYMLRESDNGWRIVNVVAQGVSDLSLKRADYTAVIKSEGFDSLVARLREKTAAMRRGP